MFCLREKKKIEIPVNLIASFHGQATHTHTHIIANNN